MTDNVSPLKPAATEERSTEGITLLYGDCNNRVFASALEKLDEFTGWKDRQDLWRFSKIKSAFDRESKKVRDGFQKLITMHAVHVDMTTKDDNGEKKPVLDNKGKVKRTPKMVPNARGMMDFIFEDQKAFDRDYKLLMNQTFHIKAFKLLGDDLVAAGLTPKEIRACARLIHNIDPDLIDDPAVADEEDEGSSADDAPTDTPAEVAGAEA